MEFIVEARVPTAAGESLLEGLFDQLDLTGGTAEVLFGEADADAKIVHVAFQIDAPNERKATFEVMQVMSPALHSLGADATNAMYDAREVGEYEKRSRRRWKSSFGSAAISWSFGGALAGFAFHAFGKTLVSNHNQLATYLIGFLT